MTDRSGSTLCIEGVYVVGFVVFLVGCPEFYRSVDDIELQEDTEATLDTSGVDAKDVVDDADDDEVDVVDDVVVEDASDAGETGVDADAADVTPVDVNDANPDGGDDVDTNDGGIDVEDTTVDVGPPVVPGIGDLVISEVMAHPSALPDSEGEWLELYNPRTATSFVLDECELKDEGVDKYPIDESVVVDPGEYVTLAVDKNPGFGTQPDLVYDRTKFYIANDEDELILECDDTEVDAFAYTKAMKWPTDGAAKGLDPDKLTASENDSASNWCDQVTDQVNGDKGTPGKKNDDC